MSNNGLETLRGALLGRVLLPADDGYDAARRIWNVMIDKRPAAIARCTGVADVVAALRFARENDLAVAVHGGGHNVAGSALCEGGLLIDLSAMRAVHVDSVGLSARAQGGATWGDYDRETQVFGLASTGGAISTTGIGGLTLGGGFGWLSRSYGLACDELISAQVVTADGRVVTASADENPDLFWGLRGGGGNFGIVTSFEYRLHEVGELLAGLLLFPRAETKQVFEAWADVTASAPDELGSMAALLDTPDGDPVAGIYSVFNGPHEEGEKVLAPLRRCGTVLLDEIGAKPYCVVQQAFDAAQPPGRRNYWKSHYLAEVGGGLIEALVDRAAKVPSPTFLIAIEHLFGGAVARIGAEETAYGQRDVEHNLMISSAWDDPGGDEANVQWAREAFAATMPFSTGAVYVNYLNAQEADRIGEAYGPEHTRRLVELKKRWDPDNAFHHNQNIAPSMAAGG
ncbi:MAG TPA: FAD-binding oxidoreductase [Thermoanaerobaculia bacterium]|nr:FAD-binding oxidoreductase [Thermoanaerobaculia bacterium]